MDTVDTGIRMDTIDTGRQKTDTQNILPTSLLCVSSYARST